jgi:hypothetical protein
LSLTQLGILLAALVGSFYAALTHDPVRFDCTCGGNVSHEQLTHTAATATAAWGPRSLWQENEQVEGVGHAIVYSVGLRTQMTRRRVPSSAQRRSFAFTQQCPAESATEVVLGRFASDWDHTLSTAICEHGSYTSLATPFHRTYTRLFRSADGVSITSELRLTCMPGHEHESTRLVGVDTHHLRGGGVYTQQATVLTIHTPLACSYQCCKADSLK